MDTTERDTIDVDSTKRVSIELGTAEASKIVIYMTNTDTIERDTIEADTIDMDSTKRVRIEMDATEASKIVIYMTGTDMM